MQVSASAIALLSGSLLAILSGGFAYLSIILSKESKTSDFRQAWIERLREDIAIFCACGRSLVRTIEQARVDYKGAMATVGGVSEPVLKSSDDFRREIRHKGGEALHRIKLRLNPLEANHILLLVHFEKSIGDTNRYLTNPCMSAELAFVELDKGVELSRTILKEEWDRVKAGEPAYKRSKRYALGITLVALVVFVAILFGYIEAPALIP